MNFPNQQLPININDINHFTTFYEEVIQLLNEAKQYLSRHRWCQQIQKGWLFTNLGYPLCIFLFEIENSQSPDDRLVWVIVGDFPSMYLDTYHVKTTREVVELYVQLASEWLARAEQNEMMWRATPFNCFKKRS